MRFVAPLKAYTPSSDLTSHCQLSSEEGRRQLRSMPTRECHADLK